MKHTKKIFALLATVFISMIALGQNHVPVSEFYLSGKWTATCATEIVDKSSIRNCELCPFVIDPNDKSSGTTKAIDLTFQNDSILINQNGKVTTVAYIRNKDTHAVSFTLNNKQYNFRMFLWGNERILEDSDGLLLVLTAQTKKGKNKK